MSYDDLCAGLSSEALTLAIAALDKGVRPLAAVDAKRFRTIMDTLGVDRHGLAGVMRCDPRRLVRWKSGARPIPADAAEWLESVMRDPPQDIVEWYEEMARNPPPFLRGRPREETP